MGPGTGQQFKKLTPEKINKGHGTLFYMLKFNNKNKADVLQNAVNSYTGL